ncbi:MAG: SDR family oxidoreductase, partial [Aquihabitans sp.]
MKNLDAKICMITGAASGIGRASALLVAGKGARLVLTDVDSSGLEKVAVEAEAAGAEVLHAAPFDISDHEAVVAFAADVHAKVPSVDVVMNIAGTSIWGSIENLEHEHWQQMVDINLMGPISVLETFVPPMIAANRGGHIVNVSSAAGLFGLPWHAAYSASKFGLRGVSEVLRFDLAPHNIGVSVVCPGAVKTPLVNTMRIIGIDQESPEVKKTQARFEKHAITPKRAAECIVSGIERNKYLVLTSPDIKIGHLAQRVFPPGYRLAMKRLNKELMAVARKATTRQT